ncbi:glycosyltransferase family 4 protein [Solimicrobium silvestre]|uniref:Gkycosyl transferase family 4 group n=1 Tax=Solimicrobium silvestre TaxID=2099400 RepID=A0A2S9GSZ0_9BURK|nr:glycosyltransferase family 4 protein [Solimicrobium silvestre]PRC90842.1 Gkycosyl transferase family 4 group [Solimicrobium silvestre]
MKILFIHQNFPGQYLHLARHLGAMPGNDVVFITQRTDADLPGVRKVLYKPQREVTRGVHHYLRETEAGVLNAQNVARVALSLKEAGFVPDVILGHNGWGEIWYLKEVFPTTPLIGYFEFFYRQHGADVGFEPGPAAIFDVGPRIRTKNIGNLLALDAADYGQCPTQWQKSLYPKEYQSKLHIVHEGVDTQLLVPDQAARFTIPNTDITLTTDDEVVTYVSRNLEPYRGFPSFMRSLPTILAQRPNAQVLVVGSDEVSYGPKLAGDKNFRQLLLEELGNSIDLKRVHFLGKVPYSSFMKVLQVSTVHVYLTYPFVLSWSMLEAMSIGCVIVGSRTQPVEEVIRDGENGVLVDIFSPEEITSRVVDVLTDRKAFEQIRQRARQTIVENYDLRSICLPAQLRLMKMAAQRML